MQINTLARPYAEAAFSLASGDESGWNNVLQLASALILSQDTNIKGFLNDPRIDETIKSETFIALLEKSKIKWSAGDSGKKQKQFFEVLSAGKRLTIIPEITECFNELFAQQKGEFLVNIESAYPMSKEVEKLITEKLEKVFGVKLSAEVSVNEKLIGGFRALVGSKVYDCSLATNLEKSRHLLMAH